MKTVPPNFDALAELVISWCQQATPTFGTAGFCFSYARSPTAKYTYTFMQRHPGIEHMELIGSPFCVMNWWKNWMAWHIVGHNWSLIVILEPITGVL